MHIQHRNPAKSHLVNKRFEGLLDRMRPNFQSFRIPFHFTLFYLDITAHCGCTSTHGGRKLSLNENSRSLLQTVLHVKSGNALEILLLKISIILVTWLWFWNATPKVSSSNHQRNGLCQTFFDFFHKLVRSILGFCLKRKNKQLFWLSNYFTWQIVTYM